MIIVRRRGATFALIVAHGDRGWVVAEAPPIAAWTVGKSAALVWRYYKDRGARVSWHP